MNQKFKINVIGIGQVEVEKDLTLYELSKRFPQTCKYSILGAIVNNEIYELHKKIREDCTVKFIDITSKFGFRMYQRTTAFIMICAAKEILGKKTTVKVEHSINKNYYCEMNNVDIEITQEILNQIEDRMLEIVESNAIIEKISIPTEEGIRIARDLYLYDKVQLLKYRRTSSLSFYKLNWFYDYFYGAMAYNTGSIKLFRLIKYMGGFIIQFPLSHEPDELPEMMTPKKISAIFNESNKWAKILNADTVGSLNDIICVNKISDFIRTNEALHEKKIAEIADKIFMLKKKLILISGPSSSGKTTFAERLSIQMRVNGLKPHIISLDNYYVDRELTPLDEFGNKDFEDLYALDVEQINKDLEELLEGLKVELPTFNFLTGKKEYKGNFLKLHEEDVLIVEGIHGLNRNLTYNIDSNQKFKIFISALTQLNIDNHNRIPTTDTRLIRRIVRDNQFRGFNVANTLAVWDSVGRGESKHIFPFQEEADAIFNSALIYELCVLKQFAEPLLFDIDRSMPEYTEARRLIKFLDSFIGISSENVPRNSILREFIGGSCFYT